MLFKMLGRERAYLQGGADAGVSKPRQLFVTQSPNLAARVEEYCGQLMDSLLLGSKSKHEIRAIAEKRKGVPSEEMLFDFEDDTTWKANLPPKFSLLEDHHFPLFLSFDKVCPHPLFWIAGFWETDHSPALPACGRGSQQ